MRQLVAAKLKIPILRDKYNSDVCFASKELLVDCLVELNRLQESVGINNRYVNNPDQEPDTKRLLGLFLSTDEPPYEVSVYESVEEFMADVRSKAIKNALNQLNPVERKLLEINEKVVTLDEPSRG